MRSERIQLKEDICDFCGTCVGVCPENCIELREAQLIIDQQRCTCCEKCVLVCPLNALWGVPGS
jgi:Pyruvate/2-oxoacid:ferredoxin oxidoreductase delta subunit